MLIFSDVDGTLLDSSGNCPLPPELRERVASQHQVVLASSRTVAELGPIQQQLGWSGPMIAEDGAVVLDTAGDVSILGVARAALQHALAGAIGVARATTLAAQEPDGQSDRRASILLPAADATAAQRAALGTAGLNLTVGGRWATITAGSSKGTAARHVAERLGITAWAAIGDSENDAPLLSSAERGFVIRHHDGHHPLLSRIPGVVLLETRGPLGWSEMLQRLTPEEQPGD